MYQAIVILFASVISGLIYRMGGSSYYNTKWRDVGCSLISTAVLGYIIGWNWTLFVVFGLTWLSLTTYWKFGKVNAKWYHWLFTGIGYAVAVFPLIIVNSNLWLGFSSRVIILGALTMIWSEVNKNPVWEEIGRGAIIILTIPLLLV